MRRPRSLAILAAGLLTLGGAAGCGIPFRSPTEAPPTPTPAPDNLGTVIVPAETPAPSYPPTARIATPEATRTVSVTLQTVAFDPALDVRPGSWSPDGSALMAHVVTEGTNRGQHGHLWTVDAASASPLWDSGDIEGLIGWPSAEWLPDGRLALARTDAMIVEADGTPSGDVSGIEGQIGVVDASPDGTTLFAAGDSAWLVGVADGQARRVQADDQTDAWSYSPVRSAWRPDSRFVAVDQEGDYVIDATTAVARSVGGEPSSTWDGTAPVWLGDGWVRFLDIDGALNVDTGETQDPGAVLGISGVPAARVSVDEFGGAISPDRRYVLYHELSPPALNTAYPGAGPISSVQASFLRDRIAGTSREVEPIYSDAHWAPTSDRYAVLDERGLVVFAADRDEKRLLVDPSRAAEHLAWSPDGRWIAYYDQRGDLWLVASDGSTDSMKVADGARSFFGWPITWSSDSRRFAVAVPKPEVLAATEEAAAATSAAAPADFTPPPPDLTGVPASLVLVTIEERGAEE